ncbi:transmembrane protein 255B isoform X2 [Mauremys mutica]|uniref:transmembrane protein 255B isoform X2 n=1 Tax=Mauremys mutica TaxID=74926 RepID=UPI001D142447|nr:transmembrane protein 255B isoform X2 [Mauremys mutica]
MQPPPPATPVPAPLAVLDPTGQFAKRKKTSLWFTVSLLVVSVFILTIGLAATTRTENVTVGGYYPGIILGFGSFLGIIGINLVENRRQMLVASIVFISFGVVAAFCCAIVDGVFAARHIDPRPLYTRRCQFYSSGIGFLYDAYQTEVTCFSLSSKCELRVKSNTCYCCDLYNCENSEQSTSYYEFLGVNSCQDVVHLYRLLWASTVLNILGLFLGIVTAAILGAFKDMQAPLSQMAFSSAPPPQILYNPAQQILTYAGFCPSAAALPAYSAYPLPLQEAPAPQERSAASFSLHRVFESEHFRAGHSTLQLTPLEWQPASHFPASSSTDISLSDDTQPPSQSSSNYGLPPNAPPLYTPTYFLPEEKPPPYAP